MKALLTVASWEYITKIRSKMFIISTIIIPLIMLASLLVPSILVTAADTEAKDIAIIDETGYLGARLQADLAAHYFLKDSEPKYRLMLLPSGTPDRIRREAMEILASSMVFAVVIIPAEVIVDNEVKYFSRNSGNFREQAQIQAAVNRVVTTERMLRQNIHPEAIGNLLRNVQMDLFEIDDSGTESEGDEMIAYMTPVIFVMMFFFSVFMAAQVLMRSVIAERQNRLVEILLSSISARELMGGKILGLGLVGLSQLIFYLAIGVIISEVKGLHLLTGPDVLVFLVFFIFGYLLWASIFAAIGSMFDSEQDAQQVAMVLSILNIVPVMLSSYIMMNPNSLTTIILSFIPLLTPYFMILRIGIDSVPLWQITGSLALLIISVGFGLFIAGKIFRTAILMYGKRPTPGEIWQWIKKE